jgi:peptidoglycan/LPS O-acetylase OafA/YrhL
LRLEDAAVMRLSTYLAQTGTPPPIQRGGWLDALRFIVAAMIIIHHFQLAAPVPLVEFHPVFERGYLLTNFFIIDSGYVLTRLYGKSMARGQLAPGQFLRQRFSRVIPAHLGSADQVTLGVEGVVDAGVGGEEALGRAL